MWKILKISIIQPSFLKKSKKEKRCTRYIRPTKSLHTNVQFQRFLFLKNKNLTKMLKHFVSNTSSRPEVFCKKGVLSNFTKFTGKHLCQSLFFNKVAGLRRNSYFYVTPKYHRLIFFSWKILKTTITKKVIVCFYKIRWRKVLKVVAFVIFPTSITFFFEIHQRV